MTKSKPDLIVRNEGTIFILDPMTDDGKAWIAEHIPEDTIRWGEGVVIEHRYIEGVVQGAINDGMEVE